jgi:NADH-quinone oxidoreductase subunit M
MGIPGFSGFAAEITILIGAWRSYPLAVCMSGIGMVLVAAFTLRALKRTFFDEALPQTEIALEPITIAEKLGVTLLIFATVAVGIYPKLLFDRVQPAIESMRFLAR